MLERLAEITDTIRTHPKLVIADDFEIAAQTGYLDSRAFHNAVEAQTVVGEELWLQLRIVHRRRPGRAVVGTFSKLSVNELVEGAFAAAERSGVDPWYRFPLWKPIPAPAPTNRVRATYASILKGLPVGAESLEEVYDVQEVATLLRRKTDRAMLATSRETHRAQFTLRGNFERGRVRVRGEAWGDAELTHRQAILDDVYRRFSPASSACFDLALDRAAMVLSPSVAQSLLRKAANWFAADFALSGRSPLSGKVGQVCFSPCLTIADYGLVPGGVATDAFDMEGCLPQNTVLVDRGELKNYLFDTYYGLKENRLSTGNFRRLLGMPEPRITPSNFCIEAGTLPLSKLIEELESGLWVEAMESLRPVPAEEGKFFTSASGWRVVAGRCVEPFFHKPIEFDLLRVLGQVEAVGSDLQWSGAFGSPSLLLREMPLEKGA